MPKGVDLHAHGKPIINEKGNHNLYVNFMHDVSITNTIKVDDFKTKFLSATDTSIVMYSDVSSDGKFNIETDPFGML